MNATKAPLEELVCFTATLARAQTAEELENRYLDRIRDFVGGFAAGLYVLDPFTHRTERYAARGVSDFFLSRYEEAGRSRDPVLQRALADGVAIDNRALMTAEEWRALPVYGEVFGLHRMSGLLEVPILDNDETVGTLNFGRHDAEGMFTAYDRMLAQVIAGLVGVALVSVRERDRLTRERDHMLAALELCGEAVTVTDLRGGQRRVNAATRRLLARLAHPESALDELMAHRVAGLTCMAEAGRPQCCEIEVRLVDGGQALLRARSVPVDGQRSAFVSFLELVGSDTPSLPPALARSLTRRELEVAALAAVGLHDAEIAERLHLSQHTIKQYLKSTYSKLGVTSRVALARLAAGRGRS